LKISLSNTTNEMAEQDSETKFADKIEDNRLYRLKKTGASSNGKITNLKSRTDPIFFKVKLRVRLRPRPKIYFLKIRLFIK